MLPSPNQHNTGCGLDNVGLRLHQQKLCMCVMLPITQWKACLRLRGLACSCMHFQPCMGARRDLGAFVGDLAGVPWERTAERSVAASLPTSDIHQMKVRGVHGSQALSQPRRDRVLTKCLLAAPPGRVCLQAMQLRPRLPQALHAAARQQRCQRRRYRPDFLPSSNNYSLLFQEAEVPGARDLLVEGAVPFDPLETRYEFSPAYAGVSRCLPAESLSQSPGGRGTWRII